MVCFIRYLATTHFEPTDARNAFPCFDEPNMKAKFSVVITRERRHVALGNMPIQHTEGVRTAVAIYHLPCTPLYSTGQMGSCVHVSKVPMVKDGRMPVIKTQSTVGLHVHVHASQHFVDT